jgi:hypothetical protein
MSSIIMLKRVGFKTSPCLTPHSEVNAALRPFENFILVVVFAYMDNIILNSFLAYEISKIYRISQLSR